MKIAEALIKKADLAKKIAQVKEQLFDNLVVPETKLDRIISVDWYVPVIPHTTKKDIIAAAETSCKCGRAIMPFTSTITIITILAKRFSHCLVFNWNIFTDTINSEKRATGIQHCATGHTDRPTGTTWNMSVGKGHSLAYQSVNIRGKYFIISQCVNGVVPLVIC